jgi:ABC-2 type transport system ATP-binding protein
MAQRYASVDVEGLSKAFRVPRQHVMTIKERALHPFRRIEVEELVALREVSFQILDGEFFGIVGRNGSGKSTLLKCLASIYKADAGRIRVAGRLTPFIELGVGFNPELTALDNVVINGVMMGLSPREARARFPGVIAFAELEDFLDLKLKNYSSGMQVRLAFSLMVQSDADVLLIDEVLAVGDAAFQQKCFDAFHRLHDEGRTIVLVTHDMATIERFCDRAMLLEGGSIESMGDPRPVGERYLELNFERRDGVAVPAGTWRAGRIAEAWVEADGQRADTLAHGAPMAVNVVLEVHERIEDPEVYLQLSDQDGVRVFGTTTRDHCPPQAAFQPGERVHVRVALDNPLRIGRFFVDVSVHSPVGGMVASRPRACDFRVYGGPDPGGLVALEHSVELERELVEARR